MNCKRCSDGEATFCISCMTDIVEETDKALERAEVRIAKLRAALFCKRCNGEGNVAFGVIPCPTCGPLRKELREGE